MPEYNEKQNLDESHTNKYLKHVGEDAAYKFINSMVKKSKYYSDAMKEHFSKELVMSNKDVEDF